MGGSGSMDETRAVDSPGARGRGKSAVWGVEVMEGRGQDRGPGDSCQCGKDAAGWTILSQKSLGSGRVTQVKAQ